ncbi:MAG: hypothetical protein ACT4NL_09865 [Pseudomarimonas sp.]
MTMELKKKLSLSKQTLRDLTARPMAQGEVDQVAGASWTYCSNWCGSAGCSGACAGSTGCNSTTVECPMR